MALSPAIQGAKRPSQSITWTRDDSADTAENLTGATITAEILREGELTSEDVTGSFVITNAASGVFRWDYSTADVAEPGTHRVQFTATFSETPTVAKTLIEAWTVEPSL